VALGVPPKELNKFTEVPFEHNVIVPLVPALAGALTVITIEARGLWQPPMV
jgi:hypothetical protein